MGLLASTILNEYAGMGLLASTILNEYNGTVGEENTLTFKQPSSFFVNKF